MPDQLAIRKEALEIQRLYEEDKSQDSFNALILGEMGSGKTRIVQTCRRPVHIDSFDPGGTKHLRRHISEGWLLVDSRFELEDPLKPSAADLWIREMDRREKLGYFDSLGTYVIDSSTTWTYALMNKQLKGAGIAGMPPRFTHDYMPVKTQIINFTRRLLKLSCDFILTGHLVAEKDEATGSIAMRMLTIGDLSTTLPTLFDEVYVTTTRDGSAGIEYKLLTASKGKFIARTRIGSEKWDREEKPDLTYLLKKAGREVLEKPMPWIDKKN